MLLRHHSFICNEVVNIVCAHRAGVAEEIHLHWRGSKRECASPGVLRVAAQVDGDIDPGVPRILRNLLVVHCMHKRLILMILGQLYKLYMRFTITVIHCIQMLTMKRLQHRQKSQFVEQWLFS